MGKIISGNLNEQTNSDKRGWFIGNFIETDALFKTNKVEVKWGVHPKGEKKLQVAANKTAKTVAILVKGKFVIKFPKDDKEIVLVKLGDYVSWDANVFHSSEALEDSIILTIRWPSVPNDTIPLS